MVFFVNKSRIFLWDILFIITTLKMEKKMQIYKGILKKNLLRRWDSWVSNPCDDRIWGKRRRDGRPKSSVMSSTLQKSGSWSTSYLFNLVTKRSFLWHWSRKQKNSKWMKWSNFTFYTMDEILFFKTLNFSAKNGQNCT